MQSTINFGYLIFLSVVAALGGFLFGYDTAVISGTIAQVTQLFQLDALQQGWYVGCALVGSIIGVLFAGILSDKLGRKLTMVISAILFSASARMCSLYGFYAISGVSYNWGCRDRRCFHSVSSLHFGSFSSTV